MRITTLIPIEKTFRGKWNEEAIAVGERRANKRYEISLCKWNIERSWG